LSFVSLVVIPEGDLLLFLPLPLPLGGMSGTLPEALPKNLVKPPNLVIFP
jgi:hypothetical protein